MTNETAVNRSQSLLTNSRLKILNTGNIYNVVLFDCATTQIVAQNEAQDALFTRATLC